MSQGFGGAAATIAIPKGHYLTVKTGEITNVRKVYEAFKTHARSLEIAEKGSMHWQQTSTNSPIIIAQLRWARNLTACLLPPSMTYAN
jgi:hypothetical protein